jgi:hypothetical protein
VFRLKLFFFEEQIGGPHIVDVLLAKDELGAEHVGWCRKQSALTQTLVQVFVEFIARVVSSGQTAVVKSGMLDVLVTNTAVLILDLLLRYLKLTIVAISNK